MNTVEIDTSGMKLPSEKKMKKVFRDVRAEILAAGSAELRRIVEASYSGSGIHTRTGKVLSWQETHVKKGYIAVRPKDRPTGPDGPGAITNYLESGHKIRKPGKSKRYRPRRHLSKVPGYRFYRDSQTEAARLKDELGERMAQAIAAELETLL